MASILFSRKVSIVLWRIERKSSMAHTVIIMGSVNFT